MAKNGGPNNKLQKPPPKGTVLTLVLHSVAGVEVTQNLLRRFEEPYPRWTVRACQCPALKLLHRFLSFSICAIDIGHGISVRHSDLRFQGNTISAISLARGHPQAERYPLKAQC